MEVDRIEHHEVVAGVRLHEVLPARNLVRVASALRQDLRVVVDLLGSQRPPERRVPAEERRVEHGEHGPDSSRSQHRNLLSVGTLARPAAAPPDGLRRPPYKA